MYILRWLFSKKVRNAAEFRNYVLRTLSAQRDLLSELAISEINDAADKLKKALKSGAPLTEIQNAVDTLDTVANKWLKPYPNPAIRENVETILVALVVVLAFRTFFFQPMKIPTGSMQPTLYGITFENLKDKPDVKIPGPLSRFVQKIFNGVTYYHIVAKEDGTFDEVCPQEKFFLFFTRQRFKVGNQWYSIIYRPSALPRVSTFYDINPVLLLAGVKPGMQFKVGEEIVKLKVVSGDHLFVNRLVYNFRHPRRGEIVIFETTGISGIQQNTFYIKRLVAFGGEHVRIGNDRHIIINDKRLDASVPNFENIYSFSGPPAESQYSGHVNGFIAEQAKRNPALAPLFPDETAEFIVPTNHFLVFGDNTLNSLDSRAWGSFPREKVIGKAGMVYWPISPRFGWGYR
jgi:signal peptidase I